MKFLPDTSSQAAAATKPTTQTDATSSNREDTVIRNAVKQELGIEGFNPKNSQHIQKLKDYQQAASEYAKVEGKKTEPGLKIDLSSLSSPQKRQST